MTSFLILHKVYGKPAFDVANQMVCPICSGNDCGECDGGFWWIVSTSGHRAYPYWACQIIQDKNEALEENPTSPEQPSITLDMQIPEMPAELCEHYRAFDKKNRTELPNALASVMAALFKPKEPIKRRV